MSLLSNSFRAGDAEDMSFDPVPNDWYVAKITNSEIKITGSGDGEYIKNTWEILESKNPKFVGRKIFQNLNIVNKSEMAVKIAHSMLKQICEAIGVDELTNTEELVGVPLKIKTKIKPGTGGYDPSNDITKVKDLNYNPDKPEDEESNDPPWND